MPNSDNDTHMVTTTAIVIVTLRRSPDQVSLSVWRMPDSLARDSAQ